MRRLAALALVALFSALPATAQTAPVADTVAAWRYAPLGIGDEWVYSGLDRSRALRIVSDTIVEGVRYLREDHITAIVPVRRVQPVYVRFDTAASKIQWLNVPGGYSPSGHATYRYQFCGDRFDAPLYEPPAPMSQVRASITANTFTWQTTDGETVLRPSKIKQLKGGNFPFACQYVADLGLVSYEYEHEGGPGGTDLVYARVGGRTYGVRPLWVDASAAAQPGAQDVRAFPQPFAGRLQVEAQHVERGEAVLADLLGRRVARVPVEAGRAEIDGSALAPGVYVLRVCAEGGGACTTRAVVRR